jgi:hypothetical protein
MPNSMPWYRPQEEFCALARVFKNEFGRLTSISLEHDSIKAALSAERSFKWDGVLDPLSTSQERDTALSELLDLPLSGEVN